MNYYIEGNAANADKIKAAFEKLGFEKVNVIHIGDYANERLFFFTENGKVRSTLKDCGIVHIIKTHPDYKELELPVEPEFKVGDWIVKKNGNTFYGGNYAEQITLVEVDEKGKYIWLPSKTWVEDKDIRLWTIADAKDGDVLATNNIICIFKKLDKDGYIISPCIYTAKDGLEVIDDEDDSIGSFGFKPATKEDRELLFRKMQEAGYEWDEKKKELRKTIEPKFKVGDSLQSGCMWAMIRRIDTENQRYICQFDNVIPFEEQDRWNFVPKKHYAIANFHTGMPVLVRPDNDCAWDYSVFSRITDNEYWKFSVCNGVSFTQCIPFEGNEHLLGTTDTPSEEYINW